MVKTDSLQKQAEKLKKDFPNVLDVTVKGNVVHVLAEVSTAFFEKTKGLFRYNFDATPTYYAGDFLRIKTEHYIKVSAGWGEMEGYGGTALFESNLKKYYVCLGGLLWTTTFQRAQKTKDLEAAFLASQHFLRQENINSINKQKHEVKKKRLPKTLNTGEGYTY